MISYRLKSLVKYINAHDKVVDIGCDHALLDIYLVENNIINNIIVSDIHQKAFYSGINNIKKHNLNEKIDARLGDGLSVLTENDEIDTIIISGMGATTILGILNNPYITKINKLIIQSNNDHNVLRKEIIKLGFFISDEEYFIDNGKNYINIVFLKGNKKYSKVEIKYGPILIQDNNYLLFEKEKITKIINIIPHKKLLLKRKINHEINLLDKYIKRNKTAKRI